MTGCLDPCVSVCTQTPTGSDTESVSLFSRAGSAHIKRQHDRQMRARLHQAHACIRCKSATSEIVRASAERNYSQSK